MRGSKLISLSVFPFKAGDINWTKKVILLCRSGARSFQAADFLSKSGKEVMNLEGGIEALRKNNCPYLEP